MIVRLNIASLLFFWFNMLLVNLSIFIFVSHLIEHFRNINSKEELDECEGQISCVLLILPKVHM